MTVLIYTYTRAWTQYHRKIKCVAGKIHCTCIHVHVHVYLNKTDSCAKLLIPYSKKFLEGAKFGVLVAICQNINMPF